MQRAHRMLIATWFHGDEAGNAGTYPQTFGDSTDVMHWRTYFRCIDLLLASASRWAPGVRLLVVLNPAGARALSRSRRELWRGAGAAVVEADNTHQTPASFPAAWKNQFFVLDCLRAVADRLEADDEVGLLLDSDCLVTGPLDAVDDTVREHGRGALEICYSRSVRVNGLSRVEMDEIATAYWGREISGLPYLGGEFVGATAARMREDLESYEALWAWNLARERRGEPFLREEAQLMSVASAGVDVFRLPSEHVSRMWTQPWGFRNTSDEDLPLIAHLPAEKRTGLPRLRSAALDPDSWFWAHGEEEWRAHAGALVGVPRYRPGKLVRDLWTLSPRAVPSLRRRWASRGQIHG
ncbi:hypothetical protein ACI8AC_17880 [Geodermatophilus sp. SYSU D00758]